MSSEKVQLQINNSGAWKTIARFDAGDPGALYYARQGAVRISVVDRSARWRIATQDALPIVLETYDPARGWQAAAKRPQ